MQAYNIYDNMLCIVMLFWDGRSFLAQHQRIGVFRFYFLSFDYNEYVLVTNFLTLSPPSLLWAFPHVIPNFLVKYKKEMEWRDERT